MFFDSKCHFPKIPGKWKGIGWVAVGPQGQMLAATDGALGRDHHFCSSLCPCWEAKKIKVEV